MEQAQRSNRARINVSLTAKGLAQWDVTVEHETAGESGAALAAAIDEARRVIREKGLKEAGGE